jgi:hypothetical protein
MVPPSSEATLDDDDDTDDGSGQPDEPSSPDMLSATADDEDRTIHRPNRFPSAAPSSPSPSIPASSSSERTIQRAMSFPLPAESEDAPHTIRQPDETAAFADDADPFDLPTKSDPNLRKLVERELALQKARREGGK